MAFTFETSVKSYATVATPCRIPIAKRNSLSTSLVGSARMPFEAEYENKSTSGDMLAHRRRIRETIALHIMRHDGGIKRAKAEPQAGKVAKGEKVLYKGRTNGGSSGAEKKAANVQTAQVCSQLMVQNHKAREAQKQKDVCNRRFEEYVREKRYVREEREREKNLTKKGEGERQKAREEKMAAERSKKLIERKKRNERRKMLSGVARELEETGPLEVTVTVWRKLYEFALRAIKSSPIYTTISPPSLPVFAANNLPPVNNVQPPMTPAYIIARRKKAEQDAAFAKSIAEELQQRRSERLRRTHERRVKKEQDAIARRRRERVGGDYYLPGPSGMRTVLSPREAEVWPKMVENAREEAKIARIDKLAEEVKEREEREERKERKERKEREKRSLQGLIELKEREIDQLAMFAKILQCWDEEDRHTGADRQAAMEREAVFHSWCRDVRETISDLLQKINNLRSPIVTSPGVQAPQPPSTEGYFEAPVIVPEITFSHLEVPPARIVQANENFLVAHEYALEFREGRVRA